MLLTSSQSSTHRPLTLSVEELFALDRHYSRLEQQSSHQNHFRPTPNNYNLNRYSSRSLDLVSSPASNRYPNLPTLEVHGFSYTNRPQTSKNQRARSNSTDHLSVAAVPQSNYLQRSKTNDLNPQRTRHENINFQQNENFSNENRSACKLRRRPPIKRESSRRIAVRPMVHRRRQPSTGSSIESLDQLSSPPPLQKFTDPVPYNPSTSLVEDVIDDLIEETKRINARFSEQETEHTNDDEINLFEMRVPIGKTYDTSDISVQLEGSKILVHCHAIEKTDRRGNYRKHEFKTELLVPEIVNDETIVSYLTDQGELIVEGKYHSWAWKQMKNKRKTERNVESKPSASNKNDGTGLAPKNLAASRKLNPDHPRTILNIEPSSSFSTINDGEYIFTNDRPPILHYYLRLPFETLMDAVRIYSDAQLRLLKVFVEQPAPAEKDNEERHTMTSRSPSRICCLPPGHVYDYNCLRVIFLKEQFIRIELPTIDPY